jgi:MATE family multidrug resistance protein
LAAVGLAGDLMIEIMLFCMAIVSIVGVLVAQALGAGDDESGARHLRQGLWLAAALSIPGMLLCWNLPSLLALTGQDPAVLAFGETYLHAVVWCFLPSLWFVVLREFVAALSRPQSVMVITIGAVGLNAVLTYGLVHGAFGLPALGVAGAGWATTIVCWAMFAALAWHVARAARFRSYRVFKSLGRIDPAACRQILVLGMPLGGLALMEGGLFAATAILMGVLGAEALAANQIVITVIATTFVTAMALGEAAAIRVAYCIGAGDPAQAQRAGLLGIGLGVLIMAAAAAVFLTAPETLAGFFLDLGDPANRGVVELTASLFVIAALFQIFDGMQAIASRALRGLRDTFAPMWIAGLGYWGFAGAQGLARHLRAHVDRRARLLGIRHSRRLSAGFRIRCGTDGAVVGPGPRAFDHGGDAGLALLAPLVAETTGRPGRRIGLRVSPPRSGDEIPILVTPAPRRGRRSRGSPRAQRAWG